MVDELIQLFRGDFAEGEETQHLVFSLYGSGAALRQINLQLSDDMAYYLDIGGRSYKLVSKSWWHLVRRQIDLTKRQQQALLRDF